jgi:hypothetical protein
MGYRRGYPVDQRSGKKSAGYAKQDDQKRTPLLRIGFNGQRFEQHGSLLGDKGLGVLFRIAQIAIQRRRCGRLPKRSASTEHSKFAILEGHVER